MDLPSRLAAMNLRLPEAPRPVAAYVPAVRSGPWLVVSGQLPFSEGRLLAVGPVPSAVSLEQAHAAARQCALNALAIIDQHLAPAGAAGGAFGAGAGGDWSRFVRVVRLGVFVASAPTFTEQPKVANGASELLGELFGAAGQHARTAVGVNVLPLGATVEIELTVEVR